MDILTRFKHCPVCGGSLQPDSAKSMRCHDCGFEYFVNASAAYVALMYDEREGQVINPEKQTVYISHGDCEEDAQYVAQQCRERLHVKDVLIHYIDPVIGAHSGPGTVALFFFGEQR